MVINDEVDVHEENEMHFTKIMHLKKKVCANIWSDLRYKYKQILHPSFKYCILFIIISTGEILV